MDITNAEWRKSSRSSEQGDACVEVALASGLVGVRDSKDPSGPKLILNPSDFRNLANVLKNL
ncbi:hypothetical protein GCM10022254_42790 [Actinomadura meridiana]|uniref:DUF397 domain-containing protein n=1 Tax=Actinomadura meridiana TaxID=559626 RepID=A0ABP8C898_9ACTN